MNDRVPSDRFLELSVPVAGHYVRIDLHEGTVTTAFRPWFSWHPDTRQQRISDQLVHFVEPDGRLVGVRSHP